MVSELGKDGNMHRIKKVEAGIGTFTLDLPYTKTTFDALQKLGNYGVLEKGKRYRWEFPFPMLSQIQALLNVEIEFLPEPVSIVLNHSPEAIREVQNYKTDKKGKGYCVVIATTPEQFKVEYVEGGEVVQKIVAKATVKRFWDVAIKELELGIPTKSRKVAQNVITKFPLDRFIRDSGSPDASKFYGTRSEYFNYFYYPLKVLQGLCLINHSRAGYITRTGNWSDTLITQATFMHLWGNDGYGSNEEELEDTREKVEI